MVHKCNLLCGPVRKTMPTHNVTDWALVSISKSNNKWKNN